MAESHEHIDFTLKHKIFLAIIVPLFILGLLEGIVRVFHLEKAFEIGSKNVQLEMPTWMLRDANAALRNDKRENIDWFDIFTEGNGFRVSLIPNTEKAITNSFSLLKYDQRNKYKVKANSIGFRGPEISEKKPQDAKRILVFGDSSSFGWGVNQNEYYTSLLAEKLSKNNKGLIFEVANFAIPGDSSEYGRLIAEKYIPKYESDLVILGFGANDAKRTFISHTSQVDSFRSQSFLQKLKLFASYSALFRLCQKIAAPKQSAPPATKPKKDHAVEEDRYGENIKEMAALARKNNAETLVLNLCTPTDYARVARRTANDRNMLYCNGQNYLMKKLPEIKNGTLYPELVEEMKAAYGNDLQNNSILYISSDGCHPNKLGHRLVADQLSDIIARFFHIELNANP